MEATYISSSSFSVEGSRIDEFLSNRRLKLDCETDGIKYASIVSSTFTTVTTVIIDESVLTANLTEVFYSILKPGEQGNISDHFHTTTEGDGGYIVAPTSSFIGLTDTPSTYSGTEDLYLQSTGSGTVWSAVSATGSGTSDVESFLDLNDTPDLYPMGGDYIGLTIASSEINTTLIDFPIMLNISEDSGIGSEDLSNFFTALEFSVDEDDFTGTDDAVPNTDLWTTDTNFYISNNQLKAELVATTPSDLATLYANYKLQGDFDIQIDVPFMDWNQPSQTAWPYVCMLYLSFEGETDYFRLSIYSSTGTLGTAQIRINSSTAETFVWAPSSTKMRIIRSGSSITGYFWNNNRWEWDGDINGHTLNSMPTSLASFYVRSEAIYSYVNVKYDNFKLTTGTIVWPEGTHPNRKKIQIKDSGGNQLYTEIETWDHYNKKVVLHTKVPYISSSVDTNLNLFYDASFENNTEFIGDTGEWVESDITGDDFTGANDSLPNQVLWGDSVYSLHSDCSIQLNNLQISSSTIGERHCPSLFKLQGDFDIQVDYDLNTSPITDFAAVFNVITSDSLKFVRLMVGLGTNIYFQYDPGTGQVSDNEALDYRSGKMRLVRVNSDFSGYIWTGSVWEQVASTITCTDEDLHVDIFTSKWTADLDYVVDFDNFTVTSGTVIKTISQNVWDSNYKLVFHMAQDPSGGDYCILDSTVNSHYGTPSGTMTASDLVDSQIGKAIDFDGLDDYIVIDDTAEILDITDTLTIETFAQTDVATFPQLMGLVSKQEVPALGDSYGLFLNTEEKIQLGSYGGNIQGAVVSWETSKFYYIAGTYNSTGLVGDLFLDDSKEVLTVDNYDTMAGSTNSLCIGVNNPVSDYWDGKIGEVRISSTVRSDAWLKATSDSLADNLITYDFNYLSKYLSVNNTADGLVFKDFDLVTHSTLVSLTDTPSTYSGTEDMYLRSTGSGAVWSTVSGAAGDFVPWNFGEGTISGTGDIYCNDIYTASGTVHIGDLELSTADGETLLVNGSEATSIDASGFNGNLATTDDTIQEVAQVVDDLALYKLWTGDVSPITEVSAIRGFRLSSVIPDNGGLVTIDTDTYSSELTDGDYLTDATYDTGSTTFSFTDSLSFGIELTSNMIVDSIYIYDQGSDFPVDYNPSSGAITINAYTSADGQTWVKSGQLVITSNTDKSTSYKDATYGYARLTISLDEPVSTKYLAFTIVSGYSFLRPWLSSWWTEWVFSEIEGALIADFGESGDEYRDNTTGDIWTKDSEDWSLAYDTLENFTELEGTPSNYDEGQYLQSTSSGTIWATVSGSSGSLDDYVPWNYGSGTISGTGDIYCNDIYTASGTVYIGSLKLSTGDGSTLLINDVDNISLNASGFNGNLETTDDTLQEVAQKLDSLIIPIPQEIFNGEGPPNTQGVVDDYYVDTVNESLYRKVSAAAGLSAKSIIVDAIDNWGGTGVGVRSIEFKFEGSLLPIVSADITCYATSQLNDNYSPNRAFDTTFSKTGPNNTNCWRSLSEPGAQRLICVFDTDQYFDEIVVNNYHDSGGTTGAGIKNCNIYMSTDAISDVTYDADISNSDLIFDGQFDIHVSSNVVDDKVLELDFPLSATGWQKVLQGGSALETFLELEDTPTTYSGGQYLRTTTSGIEAIDGIIMTASDTSEWLIQVTNSGTLYTTEL